MKTKLCSCRMMESLALAQKDNPWPSDLHVFNDTIVILHNSQMDLPLSHWLTSLDLKYMFFAHRHSFVLGVEPLYQPQIPIPIPLVNLYIEHGRTVRVRPCMAVQTKPPEPPGRTNVGH